MDVVGAVHFMGLSVEPGSAISIVLCVGLAVDFSCHVGHAFVTEVATARETGGGSGGGDRRKDGDGGEDGGSGEDGAGSGNGGGGGGDGGGLGGGGGHLINDEGKGDTSRSGGFDEGPEACFSNEDNKNNNNNNNNNVEYPTRGEAAEAALIGVGPAVLRGGMSTLLALSVLILAESFAFIVFLKVIPIFRRTVLFLLVFF